MGMTEIPLTRESRRTEKKAERESIVTTAKRIIHNSSYFISFISNESVA